MLKNIKSLKFFKKIFMNLLDYRLLELIKYNKFVQNSLNINLYNYKIFKGKYVDYDTNGKGKEYDYEGNLKFEGEYLNGKKIEK